MQHGPADSFRRHLVDALSEEPSIGQVTANRLAELVCGRFLTCIDQGGPHLELLDVALDWQALCGAVVAEELELPSGVFAGRVLVGALWWCDGMRPFHQYSALITPPRQPLDFGPIEAATCMALWNWGRKASPRTLADPLGALLREVAPVVARATLDPVDRNRLGEALERLRIVRCLALRRGWLGLRDTLRYQFPGDSPL